MKPLFYCFLFFVQATFAQTEPIDSTFKFEVSGFIDTFYSYDFDNPKTHNKLPFLYNYNRHNEFNINMALLRTSVSYKNVYGKIAIQYGTYVDDNYTTENTKILNEAFVGLYLNPSKNTSLEVGILPSYIGFETASSHVNLTATRSLLAENSPYFMTGIKLNHNFSDKLSVAFLATNGWQRINKPRKDVIPSIGTQLVYRPFENTLFNWSTYIGKEFVGSEFMMRYFNNFYFDKKWNNKWHSIFGLDFGIQDISANKTQLETWFSPVIITQYTLTDKLQLAHRMEYYHDNYNINVSVGLPFKTIGNSINLDYLPVSDFKIRTEAKWFLASENLFLYGNNNFSVTTTFSYDF